jgi:hypothetical protein
MQILIGILQEAVMITSFVFVMMLVIEYLNVLTRGRWQESFSRMRFGQYVLGAFLGAVPGCLGSFAVVSLYAHGVMTLGAVVATMIATSGDEAFVMLALFPVTALKLTAILFAIGLVVGWLVDTLVGKKKTPEEFSCEGYEIHVGEAEKLWPRGRMLTQLRQCTLARGTLCAALVIFVFALITGRVGATEANWVRATLLLTGLIGLFIVVTVSDHFLEEHLWEHVARRHVPRIFAWTVGALIVMEFITKHADFSAWIQQGQLFVMLAACVIGIIPESGPHLIFVTMYAEGVVPLSVLMASSIVQDGHGMLPMLAHSRKSFGVIKGINLVIGLLVGLAGYFTGW